MTWGTVRFGDAGEWLSGGTPRTSEPTFWDGDIPWISAASLTEFHISSSNRCVTRVGAENGTRLVPSGALLMVVRGMSLKSEFRMGITQREVAFGQDCKALIPGTRFYPRFLAYAVRAQTRKILDLVDEAGHGTGRLQMDLLQGLPVPLPPLEEQRGIAETLGALDDKIDSNDCALNILDALARAEFLRWRSRVELMTTSTFGEFADVFGGATPKTKVAEYWDGDFAWATPTDVTKLSAPYLFETARTLTQPGLDSSTAVMHPPGTIFMTSRATIGAFAINQLPTATNQGFIAVRPRYELYRWYLFEEMRSRTDEFIANANGSTFLEISRGRFKALPIEEPRTADLEELHDSLDPLHTRAVHLAQENQRLVRLREALLPELLSGRIRVPEAQEMVLEASGV